ncbi:MAG: protein-L-isoaspartate O-methyltransferase family protein, partial [Planctomycetia bacterium]
PRASAVPPHAPTRLAELVFRADTMLGQLQARLAEEREVGEKAARSLARLGYRNVVTKIGDGFAGWPEHAPFDKIIVTCSPENIPQPLVDQLAEGGRMIIPVGERYEQTLVLLTKRHGAMAREALVPSLFVPMTGVAVEGRRVLPDGARPELSNGGFEEVLPNSEVPVAWYYGRQIALVDGEDAPEGTRYLRLENAQPGRPAQIFQGFPVDGRTVGRVRVSLSVRGQGINAGPGPEDFPGVFVRFFNEERSRSFQGQVGPWKANGPWRPVEGTVTVPGWAREAIVQIGLHGATGRVDVDDVQVSGVSR